MWVLSILGNLFEQRSDAYAVLKRSAQSGYLYSLLRHGVAVSQCNAFVFQAVVVNGYTVRRANGILTTVTFSNGILVLVFAVEVVTQILHDFFAEFGKPVLTHKRQYGELCGG